MEPVNNTDYQSNISSAMLEKSSALTPKAKNAYTADSNVKIQNQNSDVADLSELQASKNLVLENSANAERAEELKALKEAIAEGLDFSGTELAFSEAGDDILRLL